jgi:hypothetical protein
MYDFSAPIMPLSVRIWQLGIAIFVGDVTKRLTLMPFLMAPKILINSIRLCKITVHTEVG